ncbi:hypothetical protein G647_01799 [Cladophialophora carrionii CBS 160.54]|uniref:GPI anchored serine-threonine rich protein n=1 Tax=Cladophialophora carrionii CBS 160.54 TaxID=1279043 RepID=V9DRR8_9EURO|nr:uncharacterized protein G647_01799 [Cladophialophora carrionii CBS 160.54]ETI29346.1 hypothetical protein G647_01799 [Cladophialophora carrionii CBS 160.54]
MRSFVLFAALPLLASAWTEHKLLTRATGNATACETGDKVCGAFCIPGTYTCCPDLEGGCQTSKSVCQEGDNGVYGCCPIGEICTGNGGAEFLDDSSDDDSGNDDNDTSTGGSSGDIESASASNDARPVVLSQGLMAAVVAAGIVGLL